MPRRLTEYDAIRHVYHPVLGVRLDHRAVTPPGLTSRPARTGVTSAQAFAMAGGEALYRWRDRLLPALIAVHLDCRVTPGATGTLRAGSDSPAHRLTAPPTAGPSRVHASASPSTSIRSLRTSPPTASCSTSTSF